MLSLVYASSAIEDFRPDQLSDLLTRSRRNNAALGITGMLLYVGGNFMQALEGSADAVQRLYERIRQDPRHCLCTTILHMPLEQRAFPDWSRGFHEMGALPPAEREQISSFLRDTLHEAVPEVQHGVDPALTILRRFSHTMR